MNGDPTVAGLPAGSVVQGVSGLAAAILALCGVGLGALLTGLFALRVARINSRAQLDAQRFAAEGAKERERRAELRQALSDFGASVRALIGPTEMHYNLVLRELQMIDSGRHPPVSKEILDDHLKKFEEFRKADYIPATRAMEDRRCRALMLEHDPDRRARISKLADQCAHLFGEDTDPEIKNDPIRHWPTLGRECRVAVDDWLAEQAARRDL